MKHQKSWVSWWLNLVSLLAICALWPIVAGSPGYAQESDGFKVIVNASNPTTEMPRKQVERIFLKKLEKWPSGFGITVVDQNVNEPARKAFSEEVLRKESSAVEAYWTKLIFSGMGSPPLKLASDTEILSFVGNNVGSIGYVSGNTTLDAAVKELEVTP
jgi:ABC-type phosphate transport system substrate-binding protein